MLLRHVFFVDLTIQDSLQPALIISNILTTYLYGRICLVFPATAIDKKAKLNKSWKLTTNNGWRLVLIAGGLPWIISYLTALTLRANASLFEIFSISMFGYFLLAFQILIISLAYLDLTTCN